jgi:hypothetical protein
MIDPSSTKEVLTVSTQTFSSVASDVVAQYNQVGKLFVGAYRTGAQRAATSANTRYAAFLNNRALPLVNDEVKASLITVQQQIVGAVVDGITNGLGRAEQAIDLLASGFNGGIQRAAATAGRVESAFNTSAISTVGSLTMPVAQVSLEIANRAVEGTKRLSARVIGAEEQILKAAPVAKRVVKTAAKKTAVRATARR